MWRRLGLERCTLTPGLLPDHMWLMQAEVDRLEAAVAAAEQQVTRHNQELTALEERRRAVQADYNGQVREHARTVQQLEAAEAAKEAAEQQVSCSACQRDDQQ